MNFVVERKEECRVTWPTRLDSTRLRGTVGLKFNLRGCFAGRDLCKKKGARAGWKPAPRCGKDRRLAVIVGGPSRRAGTRPTLRVRPAAIFRKSKRGSVAYRSAKGRSFAERYATWASRARPARRSGSRIAVVVVPIHDRLDVRLSARASFSLLILNSHEFGYKNSYEFSNEVVNDPHYAIVSSA